MLQSLLGSPLFLMQITFSLCCAVHCIKTGRTFLWVWIIVLFQALGAIAYFVVEILPHLGNSPAVRQTRKGISNIIDPDRDLRAHGANFAISNNVETTHQYAQQLVRKGKNEDAITIYKEARKGLFQYDPLLLIGLARIYYSTGQFGDCASVLRELMEHHPDQRRGDTRLLYAMALEENQQSAEAEREYQALADSYPGPEAKCRYAALLQKLGREAEAQALYGDIELVSTNAPKHYQRLHKEWITAARAAVKAAEQRNKAAR
jgi:hypothetical protein